ncbi:MAG: endonuclease domain-containing protein [Hyphomicrobium sp.]
MANERARDLRKDMSDAEWKLWQRLRGGQIDGVRFRRQHPIGAFIADFVCLEKCLIIEVDGAHHAEPAQVVHDAKRSRWLEARGYQILRFWSNEIAGNLDGVLDTIWNELQERAVARKRPPPPRRALSRQRSS